MIQLRSKGLVVAQHQRGFPHGCNYVGNGKGFSRTGHAQKRLGLPALMKTGNQLPNGFGLVAGGLVGGSKFKFIHQ